jgi:hypothetical protein
MTAIAIHRIKKCVPMDNVGYVKQTVGSYFYISIFNQKSAIKQILQRFGRIYRILYFVLWLFVQLMQMTSNETDRVKELHDHNNALLFTKLFYEKTNVFTKERLLCKHFHKIKAFFFIMSSKLSEILKLYYRSSPSTDWDTRSVESN